MKLLRNLNTTFQENKLLYVVNILSFVIGLTAFFIISNYVIYHFSYEKYNSNYDTMYRLIAAQDENGEYINKMGVVPFPMCEELASKFPEIKNFLRLRSPGWTSGRNTVRVDNKIFHEELITYADTSVFSMLDIELIAGNQSTAISEIGKVILSESTAKRLFKNEDPLFKQLRVENKEHKFTLMVTGIFKDMPNNSHRQIDILTSIESIKYTFNPLYGDYTKNWGLHSVYGYFILEKNGDVGELEKKINEHIKIVSPFVRNNPKICYKLQPFSELHLKSDDIQYNDFESTSIRYLIILFFAALIIIILTFINFIHVSGNANLKRTKEVCIQKIHGSSKFFIVKNFFFESVILFTLILLTTSLVIIAIKEPLNNILEFNNGLWFFKSASLSVLILSFLILAFIISGMLPSLFVASTKVKEVLSSSRSSTMTEFGKESHRISTIIIFSISLVFFVLSLTLKSQVNYMLNQDTGVNIENVIIIPEPTVEHNKSYYNAFYSYISELKNLSCVKNVSVNSDAPVGGIVWRDLFHLPEAPDEKIGMHDTWIDTNFVDLYKLKIVAGRNFSGNIGYDKNNILINEKAAKSFGFSTPEESLNKRIMVYKRTLNIIGVLKDYHNESLMKDIEANVYFLNFNPSGTYYKSPRISVRLADINQKNLEQVNQLYYDLFNLPAIDFIFLTSEKKTLYKEEFRISKIINLFLIVSLILALVSVYRLTISDIMLRKKEISIRKVLGSSILDIQLLIYLDILKQLAFSILLSFPISFWLVRRWLDSYSSRIAFPTWIFVLVPLALILISFVINALIIFYKTRVNPYQAIKEV